MTNVLRVGVAGLGSVAQRIFPEIMNLPDVELRAGADLRGEACADFENRFGVKSFGSVEAMCASPEIDVVWIASPNQLHFEHAMMVARAGKHIVCEKPLGVSLDQCTAIVEAVERAGVQLVIGHSKIYDEQTRLMRQIVNSGRLGRLIHIDSINYNEWLQRPRLPEEVDTSKGGGVVFRQGPHQIDMVRYIAGGIVTCVRGTAGRFDPEIRTEGNFASLLQFDNGATASVSFYGHGAFDVHELVVNPEEAMKIRHRKPLRRIAATLDADKKFSAEVQAMKKNSSGMTPKRDDTGFQTDRFPYWGLTIIACERGVIRQSDRGLLVYTLDGCEEIAVPAAPNISPELIELTAALRETRTAFPDATWGRATLEVCVAILSSAAEQRDIIPRYQSAPR